MLRRCVSCGRVGDGMVYDEFLKGWVCASCPTPTIAADLAALTARVSEAETTASPTGAAALSEARRYLLRATVAVELAQEAKAWKDAADEVSG